MKPLNEKQAFWVWLTIGILSLASLIKAILNTDLDWFTIIFNGALTVYSIIPIIMNWKHK